MAYLKVAKSNLIVVKLLLTGEAKNAKVSVARTIKLLEYEQLVIDCLYSFILYLLLCRTDVSGVRLLRAPELPNYQNFVTAIQSAVKMCIFCCRLIDYKNKIVNAIARQATATYGLLRSPMRALFQKMPTGLRRDTGHQLR